VEANEGRRIRVRVRVRVSKTVLGGRGGGGVDFRFPTVSPPQTAIKNPPEGFECVFILSVCVCVCVCVCEREAKHLWVFYIMVQGAVVRESNQCCINAVEAAAAADVCVCVCVCVCEERATRLFTETHSQQLCWWSEGDESLMHPLLLMIHKLYSDTSPFCFPTRCSPHHPLSPLPIIGP